MNSEFIVAEFNSEALIAFLISKTRNGKLDSKKIIEYTLENTIDGKIFFGGMSKKEYEVLLNAYKEKKLCNFEENK